MRKQKSEEYKGYRMAGIRLTEHMLPGMTSLASAEEESPMFFAYQIADKAHLVMLTEQNMIPRQDGAKMLMHLRDMEQEGVEKVRTEVGGGLHSGEQSLIRKLGEEVGGRLHLARSSVDLSEVGIRIKLRDYWLKVMEGVNEFRDALLKMAAKHVNTVMPGYTQLQHAQPITLAHYLIAQASSLQRDFDRLQGAYGRINMSPAGSEVLVGSNFPVNRRRLAELMGFDGIIRNGLDGPIAHDYFLEALSGLAILYSNLARWADDMELWSSNEFSMIDLPDRFCGTSSCMPQKKNPYCFENTKGGASNTIGALVSAFFADKGPTGLPILEHFFARKELFASLEYVIRDLKWLAMIVPEIKANRDLMRERAGSFWAQATDVANAIVREKGLPWRTAHQIVGILVRFSYERGIKPVDIDSKLLDEAAIEYMGEPVVLSENKLRKALDAVEFVKGRKLYGGTAHEESLAQITELRDQVKLDKKTVTRMHGRLKTASERLEKAIDAILAKG